MARKNLGYAGGAEVEQVHLGNELMAHGYDVCFVTYGNGHNAIETIDGIEVIKTYDGEKAGETNVLRKLTYILSALKRANADIYFHESGAIGVLPLFCSLQKKFVYRIASDSTVLGEPLYGTYSFAMRLKDIIEMKKADVVIAQSEFQRRILDERFGVKGVVIKNGLPLPQTPRRKNDPLTVLWAGSVTRVKKPQLFAKLAKSIPYARFEMIGGRTENESQLYDEIITASKKIPNLTFHGFVPYHQINRYFEEAAIFVSTSDVEGFPNTFIQAWAHYTPVVSLKVDPDNTIQNENLGFRSGTFKQLVSDATTLLENEELRKTMGENARKYVQRDHDVRKTVKKYIEIFNQLLA